MKKICVLTGSRAEYGLLKPVMFEIIKHPSLELSLIVTGLHLSKEFGYSVQDIINDGFTITKKIQMNPTDDTGYSMATSVGGGIQKISRALKEIQPDILLVLGDRIEPLAAVVAAAYMNIPIAHIHGGDSARAGLDESARHAITKFAHIHFTATKKSAKRVKMLGEDSWRIHTVGAPGVDTIVNEKLLTKEEIKKVFKINLKKPLLLVVQHSISTEPYNAKYQITETLEALKALGHQTIILYPNSDAGGRQIIKQIKKYEKYPFIKTYRTLSSRTYLSLLKYSSILLGNSSSGIIEASSFNVPVINIGSRQDGRERAKNILDVSYKKQEIIKAVETALNNKKFKLQVKNCINPYGDGRSAQRIVKILNKTKITPHLLQKKITY